MKFDIKYSKISNLYSFISNLSQWNELVCIPQRKKKWLKKTGKLTLIEKKTLKKFCQIFQKTKFNLEIIFLFGETKKIWQTLVKKIGRRKTLEIQKILKILENKFKLIWPIENKKLKVIARSFRGKISRINSNLKIIQKVCGLTYKQLPKKVKLRLFLSSNDREDCQSWYFNETIILECSGWPVKKLDYLINNIFLHECFHLFFQKNKKLFSKSKIIVRKNRKLIDKVGLKNWPAEVIFQEALISSFLPEGYLAEKFLKINSIKLARQKLAKKKLDKFSRLRFFCALNLYPLSKKYVEQNKPLDEFYLEKVIDCLKNFILPNKKGRKFPSRP